MAQDDGQERTEQPTPKRQQDARQKGQVPRSRELNTMTMLLVAAFALLSLGDGMARQLMAIIHDGLSFERSLAYDVPRMMRYILHLFEGALWMLAPLFLILVVAALLPPFLMGGWSFSWQAVQPKFNKLNPLKGLQRIFGPKGLVELFKALAKFLVVAAVLIMIMWNFSDRFFTLSREPVGQALTHAAVLILWCFLALSASLLFIALVDVPFQLWDHHRQLKMTMQEIKDEMKNTEGKPEVKGRIRQMQYQLSQNRMMAEVPKADVVVTNPTHFAVALRYEQEKGGAPVVVAKGADLIAAQIREIAGENDVPIFAAPPLARAIFYSTKLNQEIPAELYVAVAQVLAYVFQLRVIIAGGGKAPPPPKDVDVPEDFLNRYEKASSAEDDDELL